MRRHFLMRFAGVILAAILGSNTVDGQAITHFYDGPSVPSDLRFNAQALATAALSAHRSIFQPLTRAVAYLGRRGRWLLGFVFAANGLGMEFKDGTLSMATGGSVSGLASAFGRAYKAQDPAGYSANPVFDGATFDSSTHQVWKILQTYNKDLVGRVFGDLRVTDLHLSLKGLPERVVQSLNGHFVNSHGDLADGHGKIIHALLPKTIPTPPQGAFDSLEWTDKFIKNAHVPTAHDYALSAPMHAVKDLTFSVEMLGIGLVALAAVAISFYLVRRWNSARFVTVVPPGPIVGQEPVKMQEPVKAQEPVEELPVPKAVRHYPVLYPDEKSLIRRRSQKGAQALKGPQFRAVVKSPPIKPSEPVQPQPKKKLLIHRQLWQGIKANAFYGFMLSFTPGVMILTKAFFSSPLIALLVRLSPHRLLLLSSFAEFMAIKFPVNVVAAWVGVVLAVSVTIGQWTFNLDKRRREKTINRIRRGEAELAASRDRPSQTAPRNLIQVVDFPAAVNSFYVDYKRILAEQNGSFRNSNEKIELRQRLDGLVDIFNHHMDRIEAGQLHPFARGPLTSALRQVRRADEGLYTQA